MVTYETFRDVPREPNNFELQREWGWLITLNLGLDALVDVFIAAALVYQLRQLSMPVHASPMKKYRKFALSIKLIIISFVVSSAKMLNELLLWTIGMWCFPRFIYLFWRFFQKQVYWPGENHCAQWSIASLKDSHNLEPPVSHQLLLLSVYANLSIPFVQCYWHDLLSSISWNSIVRWLSWSCMAIQWTGWYSFSRYMVCCLSTLGHA